MRNLEFRAAWGSHRAPLLAAPRAPFLSLRNRRRRQHACGARTCSRRVSLGLAPGHPPRAAGRRGARGPRPGALPPECGPERGSAATPPAAGLDQGRAGHARAPGPGRAGRVGTGTPTGEGGGGRSLLTPQPAQGHDARRLYARRSPRVGSRARHAGPWKVPGSARTPAGRARVRRLRAPLPRARGVACGCGAVAEDAGERRGRFRAAPGAVASGRRVQRAGRARPSPGRLSAAPLARPQTECVRGAPRPAPGSGGSGTDANSGRSSAPPDLGRRRSPGRPGTSRTRLHALGRLRTGRLAEPHPTTRGPRDCAARAERPPGTRRLTAVGSTRVCVRVCTRAPPSSRGGSAGSLALAQSAVGASLGASPRASGSETPRWSP